MNDAFAGIITVLVAIVGVATLAVILSQKSNTAQVIGALFNGVGQDIGAAVSPITGSAPSFTSNF